MFLIYYILTCAFFMIVFNYIEKNFHSFSRSSPWYDKLAYFFVLILMLVYTVCSTILVPALFEVGWVGGFVIGYVIVAPLIMGMIGFIENGKEKNFNKWWVGLSIVSAIFGCIFFYTKSDSSDDNEVVRVNNVDVEEIKESIDSIFVSENIDANGVETKISYYVIDDKNTLEADIGYETVKETLELEVNSYGPGDYRVRDSRITQSLMNSANFIINRFFSEVLEAGEEIDVELFGHTDKIPFENGATYDGDLGSFPKYQQDYIINVDEYYYNDERIEITLVKGNDLNNQILGFLRAFAMFDDDLKFNRYLREKKRNTTYRFHSINNQDDSGGKHRKVGVKFKIFNVDSHLITPKPVVVDVIDCNNIVYLFLVLFGLIVVLVRHFATKLFSYREQNYKKEVSYYRTRLIFTIVCLIILFFVLYWLCPDLLDKII